MEIYYEGDTIREMYAHADQPDEVYEILQEKFPWVKRSEYFSVSKPSFHKVLEEDVITCCMPMSRTVALFGITAYLTARKFCLQSNTSFLRAYVLTDDNFDWMPPSAKILFKGVNYAEYGKPFPEKSNGFVDYYFNGDPAEVEAKFGLENKRGAYETWYGVTVVDGQPFRVKQYCYDGQDTFSDWDVAFLVQCKREGRKDLLGS